MRAGKRSREQVYAAVALTDLGRYCRRVNAAEDALHDAAERLRAEGRDDLADEFEAAVEAVEELAGAARGLTYDAHMLLREYDKLAASAAEREVA